MSVRKYFDVTHAQSDEELLENERLLGMFVAWAIQRGLTSDFVKSESPETAARSLDREDSPGFFFADASELCCGKLTSDDLNAQAASFAENYFRSDGGSRRTFFDDVRKIVSKLPDDKDSWELFDRFAAVLDKRYEAWTNPWWMFWKRPL